MTDLPKELGFGLEAGVFASGQCVHPRRWKFGFQNNGKQRLRCAYCGTTATQGARTRRMPIEERAISILRFYRSGSSIRNVAAETGMSPFTVNRAYKVLDRYLTRIRHINQYA